jgi:hypothetical protein
VHANASRYTKSIDLTEKNRELVSHSCIILHERVGELSLVSSGWFAASAKGGNLFVAKQ